MVAALSPCSTLCVAGSSTCRVPACPLLSGPSFRGDREAVQEMRECRYRLGKDMLSEALIMAVTDCHVDSVKILTMQAAQWTDSRILVPG